MMLRRRAITMRGFYIVIHRIWRDMRKRAVLSAVLVVCGAFILGVYGAYLQDEMTDTAETFIVSRMHTCYLSDAQSTCLKEAAASLLDRFSIREILVVFATHEREPEFFTTCHEVAHYIGQGGYQRLGTVGDVYAQSDRTCLGGVFHGAIEGYFMERGLLLDGENDEVVAQEVSNICGNLAQYERPQYFTECHHGLGHALMYAAHDELPRALALCDALETTGRQHLCYTGAFMQNVDNYGSGDHPAAMIRADDPLYPCTVLDERYAHMCYSYAVLERFQKDVEKSIELCSSAPAPFRADCFQTMGRNLTLYSDDPETLNRQCGTVSDADERTSCVEGAAYNLIVRYGPESTLPFMFCASAVHEDVQRACYQSLGAAVRAQMKDERGVEEVCARAEDASSRSWCMRLDV